MLLVLGALANAVQSQSDPGSSSASVDLDDLPGSSASSATQPTTEPSATSATPSVSPTPGAEPPPGAPVTVAFDDGDNVGTVTLNGARRITTPESTIGTPPQNGSYLVIDVTIAVTAGSVTAGLFSWRAQSDDGRTFDVSLFALTELIDSDPVTAGRQLCGELAFDAPAGPLLVEFIPLFSAPLAQFSITE